MAVFLISQDFGRVVFLSMEVGFAFGGLAGFVVGWWSRGADTPPKQPEPICQCVCNWSGNPPSADPGPSGYQWLLVGCVVALCILVASNAALALRVTYSDSSSDKELSVNVKGKSRGVYGAAKGLPVIN